MCVCSTFDTCVRTRWRPFPRPGLRCVSCYIQCEHILVTRGGAEFMFAKAHPQAWRPTCTRVCSPLANRDRVCRMVTPTRPSGYKTKYRRALKSGRCVCLCGGGGGCSQTKPRRRRERYKFAISTHSNLFSNNFPK